MAAVAVSKYLDMACIRCGVHLIAIPLRHFVSPPDTRGKPNQQHVQPTKPRFVTPMEKVRHIGKFFYKNENNREDWHKAEKRTGLTGELPLIDSAAKGGSSFFMFEGIIKPRKFVTQYVEVCADPCDLPFDEEWVVLKSIYFMLSDLHGCLQAMRQAFGAFFFRYPYDARATCQERVFTCVDST